MRLNKLFFWAFFFNVGISFAGTPSEVEDPQKLTLKHIMSDPDWMGNSPQQADWVVDSQSVIYSHKVAGHGHQQQVLYNLVEKQSSVLTDTQLLWAQSQNASKNPSKTQGAFEYQDDVYWTNYATNEVKALTSDETKQSNVVFINEHQISYFQDKQIFVYDLTQGTAQQIADFKLADDPEIIADKDYLEQTQPRLFDYVSEIEAEKSFQKKRKAQTLLSKNKTWYLGTDVDIKTFRLSPDANWLLLGTVEKGLVGLQDNMPEFVTADGYVNNRKVRPLVGAPKPKNETFYLIDIKNHQKYSIDTSSLPGINDDPLKDFKKSAAKKIGYKYSESESPRAVYAYEWDDTQGVKWSDDSKQVAILLFSYDNKDRWIVGVDVEKRQPKTLHWLSDNAWVNDWTFTEFGWLADNTTLYYLSEESGYSHIYIKTGKRRARQLTAGEYEVANLTVAENGEYIYFTANQKHPGIYEVYRVSVKNGNIEALSNMGGVNDYVLSPDEKRLVIRHSTTTAMPELYVASVEEGQPVQITHTMSDKFQQTQWQKPEIVAVPSSHIKRPIYSRFYPARSEQKLGENQLKPAVIFVHGAGYLQNSHQGWSNYFREFMFHNMLTQQGYTVLDMDYRASKGYGRDWRTAIYRNMGTPELEDLKDGAQWLVDNANVDPKRIGIYGGSYGGFMTFMALFKEPEVFAAGAALRPVTDWSHYNHEYTSNILNTPQVDPVAFEVSSPIEFADGLNKPLLICHGMVDDNVFFKDSVRLVQRLIELEKTEYFETALYPVEPHGFKQPSSWLDEYSRIYKLFSQHLN